MTTEKFTIEIDFHGRLLKITDEKAKPWTNVIVYECYYSETNVGLLHYRYTQT